MGKTQRFNKKIRRNLANMEGYRERFHRYLNKHDRSISSDRHMQHLWWDEIRHGRKPRVPAPFHNGRKR